MVASSCMFIMIEPSPETLIHARLGIGKLRADRARHSVPHRAQTATGEVVFR